MLGVDNIRFWSAKPGVFLNKMTGENLLETMGIAEPLFSGKDEEWNMTLVESIVDLFGDSTMSPDSQVEILCSERINNILKCSDAYVDDHLEINMKCDNGDLTSLKFGLKLVSVDEPRIDVFLDNAYAGAVVVGNLVSS